MTDPKHSPTPWFLAWEDGKHGVVGSTTEGKLVCIVGNYDDERNDIRKANAKHIVHCVNMHDELVEALDNILDAMMIGDWEKEYQEAREKAQQTRNNARCIEAQARAEKQRDEANRLLNDALHIVRNLSDGSYNDEMLKHTAIEVIREKLEQHLSAKDGE